MSNHIPDQYKLAYEEVCKAHEGKPPNKALQRTLLEPRFLVIGRIEGKHWSAVVTPREDNIRIISVRRSRTEEIAIYES